MIKRFVPVLTAVAGAAVLLAGSASAATQPKAHTVKSCRAKGHHAECAAAGTANHPSSLWLHVEARPHQRVFVGWDTICSKGSRKGQKKGGFAAKAAPTLTRKMTMSFKHPDQCVAAAGAQLSKNGKIHVWVTVGK